MIYELKNPEKYGYKFLEFRYSLDMGNYITWQYTLQFKDYPLENDWFPSKTLKSAKTWIKRNVMYGANGKRISWINRKDKP